MALIEKFKPRRGRKRTAEQIINAAIRLTKIKMRIEFRVLAPDSDRTTSKAYVSLPECSHVVELESEREAWFFLRQLHSAIQKITKRMKENKADDRRQRSEISNRG